MGGCDCVERRAWASIFPHDPRPSSRTVDGRTPHPTHHDTQNPIIRRPPSSNAPLTPPPKKHTHAQRIDALAKKREAAEQELRAQAAAAKQVETKVLLLEERGKSLKEKKRSLGQVCWVNVWCFGRGRAKRRSEGALIDGWVDGSIHCATNTHVHTPVPSIHSPRNHLTPINAHLSIHSPRNQRTDTPKT